MSRPYAKELSLEELSKLPDEEIDFGDLPELDEQFFRNAELFKPVPKKQLTVRLDADVLEWFRAQGRGYQTRMNAVLRAYVEAQRAK